MSNFIRAGDRTTVGGVVLDGAGGVSMDCRPLSFIGARVSCPECGAIGYAQSLPQGSATVTINGRQLVQAGDKCICNCQPSTLVASQGIASLNPASGVQSYQYVPAPVSGDEMQLAGSEGRPRNHLAQNKQTNDVARILRLTPEQAQQLHYELGGEPPMGFHEIMERAKDMFNLW
ncbi:PAAR domain-containing protein [Paraburkholderia sp. J67]|uniref:PAAR domain-containing protein n=1 Tax=Paraburkholderia sp. J67 TaxID=2805435 RepID=UPI002ABDD30D|nr:PAAR domain-containing protein [Paraburkholderia sp. J67]